LSYIRPIPLFSKEKLRKHVLRIVTQWVLKFYTSQNKFLAAPLMGTMKAPTTRAHPSETATHQQNDRTSNTVKHILISRL